MRTPNPAFRTRGLVVAALLACGLAGAAVAQTATTAPASTTSSTTTTTAPAGQAKALDRSDRRFVTKAAEGGLAEVAMGQMAAQRAAHPQVKAYAERMVADHGKANDELKTLAGAKGLALPTALDGKHKRHGDKLGKMQGADFDKAYMKHMVEDHEDTVKDFEKAAKGADDAAVKAFAAKQLPALKEHLAMARTLHDEVKKAR